MFAMPARSDTNTTCRPSGDHTGVRRMPDVDQLLDGEPPRCAALRRAAPLTTRREAERKRMRNRMLFITSAVYRDGRCPWSHIDRTLRNPTFRTIGRNAPAIRENRRAQPVRSFDRVVSRLRDLPDDATTDPHCPFQEELHETDCEFLRSADRAGRRRARALPRCRPAAFWCRRRTSRAPSCPA